MLDYQIVSILLQTAFILAITPTFRGSATGVWGCGVCDTPWITDRRVARKI